MVKKKSSVRQYRKHHRSLGKGTKQQNATQRRNNLRIQMQWQPRLPSPDDVLSDVSAHKYAEVYQAVNTALEVFIDKDNVDLKIKVLRGMLVEFGDDADTYVSSGNAVEMDATSDNVLIEATQPEPQWTSLPPPISLDLKAFQDGGRSFSSAKKQKERMTKKFTPLLEEALNKIGDSKQQLLVLHGLAQTQQVLKSLVLSRSNDVESFQCRTLDNVKYLFHKANTTSNDHRTFRKTLLMSLQSCDETNFWKDLRKLRKFLGVKNSRSFAAEAKEALAARQNILVNNNTDSKLVIPYQRKSSSIYTKELVDDMRYWLLNECHLIRPLNDQRKFTSVKDEFTGIKTEEPRYCFSGAVREIHNMLTMPVDKGGYPGARNSEGKSIISDTLLRKWIPKNLCKMTNAHMKNCVCPYCLISKNMHSELNRWRGRWLRHLERQCRNPQKTVAERQEFKRRTALFKASILDGNTGELLFSHVRDAVRSCTCEQKLGLTQLRCALGRCNDCPAYNIVEEEMCVNADASVVSFEVYQKHSFCSEHGTLPGAPTKCQLCTAIKDDPNKDDNDAGKLTRKDQLTSKKQKIGCFMRDFYVPQLETYRYHELLMTLLSANELGKERKDLYKTIVGSVYIQMDYTDRLGQSITDQTTSEIFGDTPSIGMEGYVARFLNGDQEEEMHWFSFLADGKQQDARTTFVNMDDLIQWCRGRELLNVGSSLYIITDGCCKQYRCGNILYLLSCISAKYKININDMIQAPDHGKGMCDPLAGLDKNYVRQFFRRKAKQGDSKKRRLATKSILANLVDEHGKKISPAERIGEILSDPSRQFGMKGKGKSTKRELNSVIKERHYKVMHYSKATDVEANVFLPIKGSTFVATGFETRKDLSRKGIGSHYGFYCDYHMGVGYCMARRFPCHCLPCFNQLQIPWDDTISNPRNQPKFKTPENCARRSVFEDLNDWTLLTIRRGKETVEDEIDELYGDILSEHETIMAHLIEPDSFAAYQTEDDDRFYIIKWTSETFSLDHDSEEVEGCNLLHEGAIVCRGKYWSMVPRAKQWYTPPSSDEEYLFRVRYVIGTGIEMLDPSPTVKLPSSYRNKEQVLQLGPKKLSNASKQEIESELLLRRRMDYDEIPVADKEDGYFDSSDEEEDSDCC